MKLNKLTGLGIPSVILFGLVALVVVGCSGVAENPSELSTRNSAKKSHSVLASGKFVKSEKATSGKAKIISMKGKHYLEFDEAFSTGEGNDVKIILYEDSSVPANIKQGNYTTLAPIKSFKGAQRYEIPETVNTDDYESVGIWSEESKTTLGYASLEHD